LGFSKVPVFLCHPVLRSSVLGFNAPSQFTPLLNLRSLIFGLTPCGWLLTWALCGRYQYHGAEQNG